MSVDYHGSNSIQVEHYADVCAGLWGRPIFSWLGPSSFSPCRKDMWVRGVEMPYQIVLLPGYRVPDRLNKTDIDSVYFSGDLSEPLVVWDGIDPYALFEVIGACFDPACEMDSFIKVKDVTRDRIIDDPRPLSFRRTRPTYDQSGSIVSVMRNSRRDFYYRGVLREWLRHANDFVLDAPRYSSGWLSLYSDSDRGQRRSHRVWRILLDMHPRGDREFLFSKDGYDHLPRQVVQGVKYGYAGFALTIESQPEWYERQLRLDYLIEKKSDLVESDYQIAHYKRTHNIPLSPEDERVLASGGDHRTRMMKVFDDKFSLLKWWYKSQ